MSWLGFARRRRWTSSTLGAWCLAVRPHSCTESDMLTYLPMVSRRFLVLFAALKDPFLGRAASSSPRDELAGFRKAAAVDLLHERREVLGRIRQLGAHVIDAEPGGVTPP